jgi:hypothetical protein
LLPAYLADLLFEPSKGPLYARENRDRVTNQRASRQAETWAVRAIHSE